MNSRVVQCKPRETKRASEGSRANKEDAVEAPPPLPATARLRADEIHVWCARLDLATDAIESLFRLLASDEAERAARFRFARDRDGYAAARGMLRTLLGGYLGEPPERIRFAYGEFGKPALAGGPARTRVRFNLSHSGSLALFAFGLEREVGIDVEHLRPMPDLEEVAERFFSGEEVSELRRRPRRERDRAFYSCWTAKEAYIKGLGEGLSMPLDEFAVSLDPPEGPIRLRLLAEGAGSPSWSLLRFEPDSSSVAALAIEGARPKVRIGWWEDGRGVWNRSVGGSGNLVEEAE